MVEVKVVVVSKVGLHARPAAAFVQEALKHRCSVTLEAGGRKANGKSILEVLALGVKHGQEVTVRTDGEGEKEASKSLCRLLSSDESGDTGDTGESTRLS